MNMRKLLLLATAILALTSSGVQAATLNGDTITFTDPGGPHSVLVGAGVDFTVGAITYDFNAGSLGDQFVIGITTTTSACGLYTCSGTTTLSLSNLIFSGGQVLTGFTVLSSQLPITINTLTPTSLSLSWTEAHVTGPATFLDGQFITAPSSVSTVPLPTALPLFASGLVGLGLLGWRRKRKAASV